MSLALTLAVCQIAPSAAAIYRWTDDSGTVHFTDNLFGVPPRYRDQVLAFDDRLPPALPPREIPLEQGDHGYLVRVRLNDSLTTRLVLDTGASATVVSPGVAHRLGLPVQKQPPTVLHTANGTVEAGWAQLDEIEVGGRRSGPLRVVVHDAVPGVDGLLGMNFLGGFRFEIRAAGPSLILSPP